MSLGRGLLSTLHGPAGRGLSGVYSSAGPGTEVGLPANLTDPDTATSRLYHQQRSTTELLYFLHPSGRPQNLAAEAQCLQLYIKAASSDLDLDLSQHPEIDL
jgi:hypothetical protein